MLDASGEAQPQLFAIGPLLRGLWYETTAVNEIRKHASEIAATTSDSSRSSRTNAGTRRAPNGIARKVS